MGGGGGLLVDRLGCINVPCSLPCSSVRKHLVFSTPPSPPQQQQQQNNSSASHPPFPLNSPLPFALAVELNKDSARGTGWSTWWTCWTATARRTGATGSPSTDRPARRRVGRCGAPTTAPWGASTSRRLGARNPAASSTPG